MLSCHRILEDVRIAATDLGIDGATEMTNDKLLELIAASIYRVLIDRDTTRHLRHSIADVDRMERQARGG